MKFIKQYDESDCGPACLTMLAIYFGKNTMISRVREWSKTDKEGTSLYGLIKGGEKLGINLTGVRADKISDIKKDELPQKINTQLHNGGSNLSGGQLQRIAIARAILRDTPILILDEATSSLDATIEKNILKNIEKFTESKTIILITHKLSNVTNADKIYLLKHGEIIEQGTHTELVKEKKDYYNLWLNQF